MQIQAFSCSNGSSFDDSPSQKLRYCTGVRWFAVCSTRTLLAETNDRRLLQLLPLLSRYVYTLESVNGSTVPGTYKWADLILV